MRALARRNKSQINAFALASSWITSHLGINPRNGGRPPRERNAIKDVSLREGDLKLWFESWLKWKIC